MREKLIITFSVDILVNIYKHILRVPEDVTAITTLPLIFLCDKISGKK